MKTKTTFKSLKFKAARFAERDLFWRSLAIAAVLLAYVLLELQGHVNLFALDLTVRSHSLQKVLGRFGYHNPLEGRGQGESRNSGVVDLSSVELLQLLQRPSVNHGNGDAQLVNVLPYLDAAFTIHEASEVDIVKNHLGSGKMLPKSGNSQNGQSRAKQVERPGVCREWMAATKVKGHSELGRNVETMAEMTIGHMVTLPYGLTDCYNNALLQIARQVQPYGTGDLSFQTLEYQGMPWYADRQCPSGRMYIGNSDKVHFYVDPAMKFNWSEKRTWPDQLLDIRLLTLKTALVYKSRLFLAVLDGWTA